MGEGDREKDCQVAQARDVKCDLEFVQAIKLEGEDLPGWLSFGFEERGVMCASVPHVPALQGLKQSVVSSLAIHVQDAAGC